MTNELFDKINIPYKYRVFRVREKEQPPVPPYGVWYISSEAFSGSDAKYYIIDQNCVIELYTANKDRELEERLENLMPASGFIKTEDYDYNEHLFIIRYSYSQRVKRILNKKGD